jgi:hypothetical protein
MKKFHCRSEGDKEFQLKSKILQQGKNRQAFTGIAPFPISTLSRAVFLRSSAIVNQFPAFEILFDTQAT